MIFQMKFIKKVNNLMIKQIVLAVVYIQSNYKIQEEINNS